MGLIAVTGASGFVGRHLVRYLHGRGLRVCALVRDPQSSHDLTEWCRAGVYRCNLPSDIDPRAFAEPVDLLIHCAYTTRAGDPRLARQVNVDGTAALLDVALKRGVRRVCFISSLSARADALSLYGQTKFEIENRLDPARDAILQLGLVVGNGGLFARMRQSVRDNRIVPLFYGGNQVVQTLYIEDLCAVVGRVVDRNLTGLYSVAEEQGVTLRTLLEALARRDASRCRFVVLPAAPVYAALWIAEHLGMRLPLSTDNLLGLRQMRHVDVRADLERIGVPIRSFAESLEAL